MREFFVKVLFSTAILLIFANSAHSQIVASTETDQIVSEIVEQTSAAFPVQILEVQIDKIKTESRAAFKDEILKLIISKAEENPDFSPEKKEKIKAEVPAFGERFGNKITEIIAEDLDMNRWIREALTENFTKNFTTPELKKIYLFIKGENGRAFFEAVKEEASAGNEGRKSNIDEKISEEQAVEIEKFMKSPLGVRFMNFAGADTEKFLKRRIDDWGAQMLKNLEESMKTGELGAMLKQFVMENANK